MQRIFHNYTFWEDYINGMWRTVSRDEEERVLPLAIEFTGNCELYGAAMIRVVHEWPISCEHNLTNLSINRRAWIGHAACCLEFGWPEYLVRQAWHTLTKDQQDKANRKASEAIRLFEKQHRIKCQKDTWELMF
jgi:hypothetical protein